MPRPARHLLICSNNRGPGHPRGSCGEKGGDALVGEAKDFVREAGLKDSVIVSRTGCLKHCSRGIVMAVYPDNVWYSGVASEDLGEICASHLVRGEPVTRLLMPDDAPWE